VASRMQVAASGFVVACGLFTCGLGGALALADPRPDGPGHHSRNDPDRRGDQDDSPKKLRPKESDARKTVTRQSPPKEPQPRSETTKPTTTRPSSPTEAPPPGQPPGGEERGGGGGGAEFEPPRGRPELPPEMQLPPPREVQVGGGPGPDAAVVDAGPPAVAAAGLPVEPITLPVIVAPPLGPVGGGPSEPGLPGGTEPPAGLDRLPANIGSDAAPSHRIGYTDYLRTAGLPQVAALAVPGVAGILVLTAAGGLVGYRQAKAGHAVRSGTARFMN
jgi:hypothetical protein